MLWSRCQLPYHYWRSDASGWCYTRRVVHVDHLTMCLLPLKVVASFSDYAQDPILTDRRFWITVFMASAILPLSFLRKLDSLKYTSLVALIAVIYLCTIVLYYFFSISNPIPPPVIEYATFSSDFFSRLPVFVFAFTCHQNVSDLKLILQHPCLIHIVN